MYILVDPSYAGSVWCQNMHHGLTTELKAKRIPFRTISSVDALDSEGGFAFLLGSVTQWVQAVIDACAQRGIHPILLSSQSVRRFRGNYSAVCPNMDNAMNYLIHALEESGRSRIALYGVNPNSVSDEGRKLSFLSAMTPSEKAHVFFNNGSLLQCYRDFAPVMAELDAVICTNDFAAISLVRQLSQEDPNELERLAIIGCAETRLTEYYSRYILSIHGNLQDSCRAAITLLETLRRNPYLSSIVMTTRWDFTPLQALQTKKTAPHTVSFIPESRDTFYADTELDAMLRLEHLLNGCDDLDRAIFHGLSSGVSYEAIAENCYITVNAVKYRVKKMLSASSCKSRASLVALIQEYISGAFRQEKDPL